NTVSPEDIAAGKYIALLEDGGAIEGGLADIGGCKAMLIFASGAPRRGDFVKAIRLMRLAAEAEVPVVNRVDWTGAWTCIGVQELLAEICECKIPLLTSDDCPFDIADGSARWTTAAIAEEIRALRSKDILGLCAARRARLQNRGSRSKDILDVEICRPCLSDVPAMVRSFAPFVLKQQILPRSEADIAASLDDFIIARKGGRIIGTVALRDFGNGLEEVRTLTVASECEGRGLGTRLVSAVIELARARNAGRIFTLTMRPNIFLRLGFFVVSLMRFPAKVQNDCLACPKKEQCDEVALLLEIGEQGK
ncbi:MAG: GNAT family N-acetyltransferase, partial [Victivallales bacterium]|nr:GNAT family N-acetyltransferase [Victivallales bacterium]